MPLEILYRDEALIAVNKPAGQLVHPSDHPHPDDEVTMKILRDQIGLNVHALHRIDRPTCGVLLFTTEPDIVRILRPAFDNQLIEKTYLAVIIGHPAADAWTCGEPLRKKEKAPLREARTDFKVLDRLPSQLALIEAKPKTGRFHQIRRHLLHAGHPIVGDYLYAGIERSDELGTRLGTGTRMLLQAKELTLAHPVTRELLTITAPLDPLIQQVLDHP
ncbi:pseudouridine synthase [Verrucomicrobiaceae bacterium 227]